MYATASGQLTLSKGDVFFDETDARTDRATCWLKWETGSALTDG